MHRLLVRQTLIEERERRRLGRALHDDVAQQLVQVRRQLAEARDSSTAWNPAEMIASVDRVIRMLHELSTDISPPVLEDLGILPAMRWLAENHAERFGATAICEDDGLEPRLSAEERTVVFRAIRELMTNAAKHAPDSQIVLSSTTGTDTCRFMVRDDGPGFDYSTIHACSDRPYVGYGLLSIEQQIRALGGVFEVRSGAGIGTCVTITLPVCSEGEHAESHHDA